MDKVKMGFVGAGDMGQLAHIANYFGAEGCELTALAEGKRELAEKVAARYGIKKVYNTHKELAEDAEVEAVAVVLPPALNYFIVRDLLNAGKHVFTEKPMGVNMKNMAELVELAGKNKLVYQVGYMKRHDTGFNLLKKYLSEYTGTKRYGELQQVRFWSFCGEWHYKMDKPIETDEKPPACPREDYPSWIPPECQAFYSRLLNIETHLTNLLRFLLEEDFSPEYVGYKNAANFIITAETLSGVKAVFECGAVTNYKWHEGVEIFFDKAILKASSAPPMLRQGFAEIELSLQGENKEIVRPLPPAVWAFAEQAEHFVRSVAGKEKPVSPASEALKDISFCEEAVKCLISQKKAVS